MGFSENEIKKMRKADFLKEDNPEEFKDFSDYYIERKISFYEKKRKENYKKLLNVKILL